MDKVKLYVNGEKQEMAAVTNLSQLLRHFEINPKSVVVEHNKSVVPRDQLDGVLLQEGDKVEIVQFVGGGQ